ncbi:hypothetical protein ACQX0N_06040 [Clostridium tepidum]|jgi:hypothetical protein|uniref:Uncharacterized protein n=1 Tax=Clostridium tepidum TaxID=1962263 RepID=A0A1S9IH06_9CLOT|nr:hypothetical protein [Clostridium tepidum]MCR1935085.1 hypothetical protein [Clostridium tepidum]MDU6877171.1 hypothetical protein [Clostridium botulinum]OOO63037.1 hypothetical protein BS637_04300 [Clostridium tepidum]OOO69611.1 hypothetical protein BS638_02105 [Clostridium tepidum]
MINVIKTAIVTIIISFISGLLLDRYKNLAPRILCKIGKGIPIDISNKKFKAYTVTVRNISNKIIHDITLNVQSHHSNLKIADAKITKGLKFDSSTEDDVLDVFIPFLSKDDEFSVTVYVDNEHGVCKDPIVVIRSPENFKEVNSEEKTGILSIFTNIPKNIKEIISDITKKDKTIFDKNKKMIIIVSSVILVMIVGVVGKFYIKDKSKSTNTKTPSIETKSSKQPNDSNGSTGGTTSDTNVESSTNKKSKNKDKNSSTDGTNNDVDKKTSTGGTNSNTNSKPSTNDTNGNKKPSTGNKDEESSINKESTHEQSNQDSSTSGITNDGDKNPPTSGGTTGNKDEKISTGGQSGNTDN